MSRKCITTVLITYFRVGFLGRILHHKDKVSQHAISGETKWNEEPHIEIPKHRYRNCLSVSLLFSLFLFATIIFHINSLHASGVVLDSMGPTSSGRGGTNISHSDNGSLIHDNPAALVNMPQGKLLDVNLELFYPTVDYDDEFDSDGTRRQLFILPSFSLTYKKSEESRFAFGVGAFTSAGFATEYRLKHAMKRDTPFGKIPVSFGEQKYRSEASLVKLLAASSFKVNDKLSLGFSVGSSVQKMDLEMPYTIQTGQFAGLTAMADVSTDYDFGFTYTLGAQYKITDNTVIGISYVSESRATLVGDADLSLPDAAPESVLFTNKHAEYDFRSDVEWPRTIGVGISHKMGLSNQFALDVVWTDWSAAFDSFDLGLTDGDNAEFNAALGSKLKDDFPLDWDSTFSIRLGYEYFHKGKDDDVLRFGYIFNDNPVPKDTQTPLIPGTVKHIFSTGYSHKWEKYELDTAYQFMMSDRDQVSTSSIIGGDFDNSSMKVKIHVLFIGLKYRF